MFVTKEELKQRFLSVKFEVEDSEVTSIMIHHGADKSDYLEIENFIDKLTCWRTSNEFNKVLDQHIDININHLRDQASKEDSKSNSKTDTKSKKSLKIKAKKSIPVSSERESSKQSVLVNNSKKYLKMAKKKQMDEEDALAMNIEKCKKEQEFD